MFTYYYTFTVLANSGSMDKHCAPVWGMQWKEPHVVRSSGPSRKTSETGPSFRDVVSTMTKVRLKCNETI